MATKHAFSAAVALALVIFPATLYAAPASTPSDDTRASQVQANAAPRGDDNMVWGNRA